MAECSQPGDLTNNGLWMDQDKWLKYKVIDWMHYALVMNGLDHEGDIDYKNDMSRLNIGKIIR